MVFASILSLIALGAMARLPRTFFRPGRFHVRWLATAAPFVGSAVALGCSLLGRVQPFFHVGGAAALALHLLSVLSSLASIAVIAWTVRTHRIPLALWHQDDDAPESLVTRGPYALVRHPFYTAFLITLVGAFLAVPHWSTLLCLGYGWVAMSLTAIREERRLLLSAFGPEYRAYRLSTGRFFPRLGALR